MNKKVFVSIVLTLILILTTSMPMDTPKSAALTPDRIDPAVLAAIEAGEDSISIIVQGNGETEALQRAVVSVGGQIEANFWIIDSVLTTLSPDLHRSQPIHEIGRSTTTGRTHRRQFNGR